MQGSENGRVVTIASNRRRRSINVANFETSSVFYTNIKSYHEKCFIFNINIETSRITFKRKHDDLNQNNPLDGHLNDKIHHKATQTDNADMYSLLSDGLESFHEMNRYDDFVSVLKCICEGIMTDNIGFQLLMDVGNFYSKDTVKNTRYTDQTLAFWVTVKKLFKGKGINFFRGFKGQGLNILRNDNIAPRDCRINFVVPSNPILTKESSKYTLDAENLDLLSIVNCISVYSLSLLSNLFKYILFAIKLPWIYYFLCDQVTHLTFHSHILDAGIVR